MGDIGGGFPFGGNMALANTCALNNPLIGRINGFSQLGIGDNPFGEE